MRARRATAVHVERIRPDQWPTLRALRLRALTEAPEAFLSTLADEAAYDDAEWERRAARWSGGDEGATFLASVGGEPAGLVGSYRLDDRSVELVAMWTAPEHRRAGVGRALVEAVVGFAADTGAHRVTLSVMRANTSAAAFYATAGFVDTDEPADLEGATCPDETRMVRAIT